MTLRGEERHNAAEQLELPLEQKSTTPFAGKVLRAAAVTSPPSRIPLGDQRLIRLCGAGSILAALVTIGGALTIDPVADPTSALAVSGTLAVAAALGIAAFHLLRSFHGHPGVWRVRRRRSLRRGMFGGALLGGYLALRIIGLGGPTGLLIATGFVVVLEAAISRSETDSV
jgi:hypothetical protein